MWNCPLAGWKNMNLTGKITKSLHKKYKVIYLPLFYKDLESIVDYIAYNFSNISAAQNLLNVLQTAIETRAISPTSYEKYYSNRKRKNTYYRIYVKNYVIFYVVHNDIMEVRRILYNKRNLDTLIN
jgi:plasmid stabilization system protein ParE